MGIHFACWMQGSDWLGPECKRRRLVVSVFGDFARGWGIGM